MENNILEFKKPSIEKPRIPFGSGDAKKILIKGYQAEEKSLPPSEFVKYLLKEKDFEVYRHEFIRLLGYDYERDEILKGLNNHIFYEVIGYIEKKKLSDIDISILDRYFQHYIQPTVDELHDYSIFFNNSLGQEILRELLSSKKDMDGLDYAELFEKTGDYYLRSQQEHLENIIDIHKDANELSKSEKEELLSYSETSLILMDEIFLKDKYHKIEKYTLKEILSNKTLCAEYNTDDYKCTEGLNNGLMNALGKSNSTKSAKINPFGLKVLPNENKSQKKK